MCPVSLMHLLVYIYIYIYIYISIYLCCPQISLFEKSRFDFREVQEIFHFSEAPRPALRPTSPPIPYPEVKRPGREADHSLPSSALVMRVKLYLYFPVRCHDLHRKLHLWCADQSNFNTSAIRLYRYYQTGNASTNVNTEARSCNHSYRGKAIRITESECDL